VPSRPHWQSCQFRPESDSCSAPRRQVGPVPAHADFSFLSRLHVTILLSALQVNSVSIGAFSQAISVVLKTPIQTGHNGPVGHTESALPSGCALACGSGPTTLARASVRPGPPTRSAQLAHNCRFGTLMGHLPFYRQCIQSYMPVLRLR